MRAYRLLEWGRPPEYVEMPVPEPGPNEVLVRVAAVGVCGSDLHLLHAPPGMLPFDPPFTLGHEVTGWVERVGAGVVALAPGDAVLASSSTSCGHCTPCIGGRDNYCTGQVNMSSRMMTMKVRGIGLDGGFAEYMVAPQRDLVKLGDSDPRAVAPLACAGATAYHAVQVAMPVLTPGEQCLVIGAGGLGSFAIQYLGLLAGSSTVVVDSNPIRLSVARSMGAAQTIEAGGDAGDKILAATGGRGIAAVLDFVGSDDTLALATRVVQPGGKVVVPGINLASIPFGWGQSAPGCDYRLTLGFTNRELADVVALGRSGRVQIETERFGFDQIAEAFDALARGTLRGRAVIDVAGAHGG